MPTIFQVVLASGAAAENIHSNEPLISGNEAGHV
jgi:hypothetical protein